MEKSVIFPGGGGGGGGELLGGGGGGGGNSLTVTSACTKRSSLIPFFISTIQGFSLQPALKTPTFFSSTRSESLYL